MRWSATRLRWVLLVGVFALAGVVAGFFGLARYRAGKIWQHILARNGVNLRRESNGITWSQSSKGHTIFTLHASKATPQGNNKWALHDAVLVLYGREPGRDDRIYGNEFAYDQDQQILRALGEVHMDLQAPEPGGKPPAAGSRPDLGFEREDSAALDPAVIHVRTSGLVYMRKLGIAATGEPAEFRFGGITCTSRGAEFDSGHSLLRLLADVKVTGIVQRTPFTLTATHAELDRSAETADLSAPVMTSGDRSARSVHALLHLHKDGSLQAAEANGALELRQGTATVTAPQLAATFGDASHPQHAKLFTGVSFADTNSSKLAHGGADTLDLDWAASGELSGVTANGSVRYSGSAAGQNGAGEQRQMSAEQATASFVAGARKQSVLKRVRLTGGAELRSTSQPARKDESATVISVAGDDLVTDFAVVSSGRVVAQHLSGTGHTQLEQHAPDGAKRRSTGDSLELAFAPKPADGAKAEQMAVSSAVQAGHVEIQSWTAPRTNGEAAASELTSGHADKATYSAIDSVLTLTADPGERATLQQSQGELVADRVVVHEGRGDADAEGDVAVTSAAGNGDPGTHVLASRAQLLHAQDISKFYGDAGRPAQMWQGGSQVQAAEITLDNKAHQVAARPEAPSGRIHAVFAAAGERHETPAKPPAGSEPKAAAAFGRPGARGITSEGVPEAERNAVEVTAARMDYDDAHHEAVFGGGVQMRNVLGEVLAERAVAFLTAPEGRGLPGVNSAGKSPSAKTSGPNAAGPNAAGPNLSGRLERLVMLGDVELKQPGRTGVGDQLTYTAATQGFALTGTAARPPQVTGEQGSVITGATLLFGGADSTIVVAGSKGDAKAGPARVHTETDLKP